MKIYKDQVNSDKDYSSTVALGWVGSRLTTKGHQEIFVGIEIVTEL